MVIVVLKRFLNKYYGDSSSFSLTSFDELQDVECSVSNDSMVDTLKNSLCEIIQDEEIVRDLIEHPNVVISNEYVLARELNHITLIWLTNFNINIGGELNNDIVMQKFPVCLLELFAR